MISHQNISDSILRIKIRKGEIQFGGNVKLKIYGELHCRSGKRMKRANRVFFGSKQEAVENGFRPCGHCKKLEYKLWLDGSV